MRRFLAALAALAFALFAPARADAPRASAPPNASPNAFEGTLLELEGRAKQAATPREELESLALLAALSMVRILESEGRYEPFTPGPGGGESLPNERWLYAGERVARVEVEEFPEYFALEECQRELGLVVGADDAELDRRLAGWRVPRALIRGAERLAERARKAG
jgi:hypothetical protein